MKWILYMMLFTTPAANVTNKAEKECLSHSDVKQLATIVKCRPEYEGKHIWSLQSASQLEFSNFQGCVATQNKLIANSNVASTMTLRTWCFCDSDKNECPTDEEAVATIRGIRSCELSPTGQTCEDARKTFNNFVGQSQAPGKGQNSTSIQLYPPPPDIRSRGQQ
ncbi:hypothetical protein LRP30_33235 [Bradyrhizobium sp. C-145]|uniref:hypothetical protein n=1 Tax=Bradyrhizobium sp. C-145 TaxID=574727 RepID=UPI00201B5769|nr:hypothetical protein [Bradyrhizobium sp. C-145]UQR61649.1 hypothetical protein LRP30_33235 [Bradyrhizobium sp. C-145]